MAPFMKEKIAELEAEPTNNEFGLDQTKNTPHFLEKANSEGGY